MSILEILQSQIKKDWFKNIVDSIKTKNRYILDDDILKELKAFFETNKNFLMTKKEQGTILFRTRIIPFYLEFSNLKKDDMLPPPSHLAKGGRINPAGIPYLYTSDDTKTAISELRPWVGANVCLAEMAIKRDLFLFDLNKSDLQGMSNDSKIYLECINDLFSQPIYSEDLPSYTPSQYIAEFIKKISFDGIIYRSTLCSNGNNIAIFDSNNVEVKKLLNVIVTEANFEFKINYDMKERMQRAADLYATFLNTRNIQR